MYIKVRDCAQEDKALQRLSQEAIEQLVPMECIESVLIERGVQEKRQRKLKMSWVVLVLILMNLYPALAIRYLLLKFLSGVFLIEGRSPEELPSEAALCFRRKQLKVKSMEAVFRRICRPMATEQTKGAFLFGMRLMAIDGHVENVPDSPKNSQFFGHQGSGSGKTVYPQMRAVYLCEAGTRAIVDAGFWPCHRSEHVGALQMVRSVEPGMLVMFDRGLHDYALFREILKKGAHVLARLSDSIKIHDKKRLSDGSYVGYLYPTGEQRARLVAQGEIKKWSAKKEERIQVRVIEYTITEPSLPGYGEVHLLITTLLDPERYPARELVVAYHERWEVETAIDEMTTHQRLSRYPLRSRSPMAVLQELYGCLIAHYLIRSLIHRAALDGDLDPDRLSFVQAFRILTDALPFLPLVSVLPIKLSEWVAHSLEWMLRAILCAPLPEKRARSNPRVVKQTNRTKFPAKGKNRPPSKKLDQPFHMVFALI